MYDSKREVGCGCVIIIIVFMLVIGVVVCSVAGCVNYYSTKTYTATITDKNIKTQNGDSTYLIYTKLDNGETRVFSIEDSLIKFRWNSSDLYAELVTGKTYKLEVIGWRIHLLSDYENIINASEIQN